MGQLYLPKLVRIQYNNKTIKEIEINVKSNLKIAREKLKKSFLLREQKEI